MAVGSLGRDEEPEASKVGFSVQEKRQGDDTILLRRKKGPLLF